MHKSLLLFLIISQICFSQTLTSIPFTVENNCIYFHCKINETDSLKLLFDTGADGSVINENALKKISLKIDGEAENIGSNGKNIVKTSSNNIICLGSIVKRNVEFSIIQFNTDKFDGIIGTNLMMDNIIEIDYNKNIINFYSINDKTINLKNYTKNKLIISKEYPTLIKASLVIDGKKYKGIFGLDTGADDILTISEPFQRENKLVEKLPKMGSVTATGSNNVSYKMDILLCPEITIGKRCFYRIPITISNSSEGIDASKNIAGFFGNLFLQKHNIIIDYSNKKIYFKVNNNLYKDFYQ